MYNIALDCIDSKAVSPQFKNKPAVLLVNNQLEVTPITFFGAMKIGAIPVPVSPLLTPDEISFMAKDSGAKLFL